MGFACVCTTDEIKYQRPVDTDNYAPSQAATIDFIDPYVIQDDIDKHIQWELEYYEWVNYTGPPSERPFPPGRHPDPKNKWNSKKKLNLNKDDAIADNDTDYDTTHHGGGHSKKASDVSGFTGSFIATELQIDQEKI